MPAGYSKRTLVEKLGIKVRSRVAIIHAPRGFDVTLGPLPKGVSPFLQPAADLDFVHAFYTEARKLDRELPLLKRSIRKNGVIWISWPKKAAKMETDITEDVVRNAALTIGLVDVKVCAVDDVWSGLKLVYRLADRASGADGLRTKKS